MTRSIKTSAFCILLLASLPGSADVLFESHDVLDIEIEAPFGAMRKARDKTVSYPATLTAGGDRYSVALSVRGNNRLERQTCLNPPLRVDFENEDIKDTLFDHQKSIKLVVQCKRQAVYRDYLRSEYLIYRLFNLLTPLSYRVRWLNLTYTDEKGRSRREPGFFIERKTRVAKRVSMEKTDVSDITVDELQPDSSAMVGLFQYLIGNADYSVLQDEGEGSCCHNARLLLDDSGRYVPVIYDFDFSGMINARYAFPPAGLSIRNVTTRLYRGFCQHNPQLAVARMQLLAVADDLKSLIADDSILSKRVVQKMTRYLDESLDHIGDDKTFQIKLIDSCRG